ncbi:MAG: hypothetical protein K6C13_04130 [Oscillospiraceae bacterium]|nr:hypothetical protein [Oscillospiraceae bacterium]
MWNEVSDIWKTAFNEAWTAFISGSTPIGAVLCDEEGKIILSDRNRNNEVHTINKKIAHAESNILKSLDTSVYDPKTLTLYSTMEPCPMCMGTILMANIQKIRYAAADPHCGMTHLLKIDPYYSSKKVSCTYEGKSLEQFQITIQSYYELRYIEQGADGNVFEKFTELCPSAAETAKVLYRTKWLDKAAKAGTDIGKVFDHIQSLL